MINRLKFRNSFQFKIAFIISGTLLFFLVSNNLIAQKVESTATWKNSYGLSLVRISPVYPDCQGLEGEFYKRKCFVESMEQQFKLNFDPSILNENDHPRAFVGLVINQDGYISLKFVSPSNAIIDSEVARVVDNLPRVSPGLRNGVPVNVRYSVSLILVDEIIEVRGR